jgi:D-cysteine desulfhydrase
VVLGGRDGDVPVIPPGATSPLGMMGTVRAGLELAEQIHGGAVPEPDRIYVALGSGGTAIGLAIGLSLGGIRTPVTAVAVVEHLLSAGPRLASLTRDALAELARWGVVAPPGDLPLLVDRDHLGSAYAHPTPASLAACVTLAAEGIDLEPVYTGKAMAAVIADARRLGLRNVLFWSTVRRALPEPAAGWRDKLPPALHRRLDAPPPGRVTRRRVLAGLAAAAAVGVGVRLTGYDDLPGFPGEVLSAWHARVILAAAEALLPPDTDPDVLERIPARLDRYLVGMPPKVKREVKAMLGVIEHGTTPLGHTLHRFTLLAAVERERYLAGLAARGDLYAQVYNGIRDLVMLGCYQQPATWKALGYEGPKLPLDYDPRGPARPAWPVYDALVAPAGLTPKGLLP